MPWTVLPHTGPTGRRAHDTTDRVQGGCRDTIEAVFRQTSAVLRRRNSEDVSVVAALIVRPHCVPCITVLTHLDARRTYAALEQLKVDANVRLVLGVCARCVRTTTVHVIGE